MIYSRIDSAASAAGASLVRVDSPADLPDDLELVLVDWSARRPDWADALVVASGRVILFGQHTDLESTYGRSSRRSRSNVGSIEGDRGDGGTA